jgi:hypothetical protein
MLYVAVEKRSQRDSQLSFAPLTDETKTDAWDFSPTLHITGSKKQSEERAALFAVRVHVIVSRYVVLYNSKSHRQLVLAPFLATHHY